jgi:ABC-2 type transport system ATP-binding protein
MKAIVTDNLTKMFGQLIAVDHISFEVEEGEIFSFLGANGAGRSAPMLTIDSHSNHNYNRH